MGRHQIFIEKDRVARSFLRGMSTYDSEAIVQRQVNKRLLALLANLEKTDCRRILEIGCGTGMLTELLNNYFEPDCLYINDLVPECYHPVINRLPESARSRIRPLFGDMDQCSLPSELDLVVSSSALQWLADLEGFMEKVKTALTDTGILAFSMFGEETLHELTQLTGAGLRYHSFKTVRDLVHDNLRIIHCSVERDQLFFKQPKDVLRHIQATGVGGAGGYTWTPRRLEQFVENYRRSFATDQGVPVSYVSYNFIAEQRKK